MSSNENDVRSRLPTTPATTLGTGAAEDEENYWEAGHVDGFDVRVSPKASVVPLPLDDGGMSARRPDRPEPLAPAHDQDRPKIKAKIPHPAKYSHWKNERGREIRRSLAVGAAAGTSAFGSTVSFAAAGLLFGSLFGGPLIGGAIGLGVGALVGAYLASKSADKVESYFEPEDQRRFNERAQANLEALAALKTLKAKHWLTQPIAEGWSRLNADQQRQLMTLDPGTDLTPAQARDVQARVMLRVGQAMTEQGASAEYAMLIALDLKSSLEAQPRNETPDELPLKVIPTQEQQHIEQPNAGPLTHADLSPLPEIGDLRALSRPDAEAIPKLKRLVPARSRRGFGAGAVNRYRNDQRNARHGRLDHESSRLPLFKDPAVGFGILSQGLAAERLSDDVPQDEFRAAISDTCKSATIGLGIIAPGQVDEWKPASGLTEDDVVRFNALGVTTAAIRGRHESPNIGPPLTKRDKATLQRQLNDAKPWLEFMRRRGTILSAYRQAFQRDFQNLSRSPNLKTLNETQAKLDALESELGMLRRYADDKTARARGPATTRSNAGQNVDNRRKDIADDANYRQIRRKFPQESDRTNRVDALLTQRSSLNEIRTGAKRRFKKRRRRWSRGTGRSGLTAILTIGNPMLAAPSTMAAGARSFVSRRCNRRPSRPSTTSSNSCYPNCSSS